MVAIVIFWAAILAGIFYVLGIGFKILDASFMALLSSLKRILIVGIGFLLAFVILYLFYQGGNAYVEGGLSGAVGRITFYVFFIALDLVVLSYAFGFFGGIILSIFEVVVTCCMPIFGFASGISKAGASICDDIYYHFLQVILNNVKKC